MKNADLPAMPIFDSNGLTGEPDVVMGQGVTVSGLTKREMFAMAAMQGILASDTCGNVHELRCAELAVSQADALLAELEK